MARKNRVFIILLLILLVLVLYLILTSEPTKETANQQAQPASNKNIILSEEEYKAKVKDIFSAYEQLATTSSLTEEKIAELENQLSSLRLNSSARDKFKTLHLDLVRSMYMMKVYLTNKIEREKSSSQQIIDKLKADFNWLNN